MNGTWETGVPSGRRGGAPRRRTRHSVRGGCSVSTREERAIPSHLRKTSWIPGTAEGGAAISPSLPHRVTFARCHGKNNEEATLLNESLGLFDLLPCQLFPG